MQVHGDTTVERIVARTVLRYSSLVLQMAVRTMGTIVPVGLRAAGNDPEAAIATNAAAVVGWVCNSVDRVIAVLTKTLRLPVGSHSNNTEL